MTSRAFQVFVLLSLILSVYLWVSAPPPLPQAEARESKQLTVQQLLDLCAAENATVRALYTKWIVGPGKVVGLQFDERWQDDGVEAGPLPALFLRETARALEKRPVPLGLFLGSDHPISKANLFRGLQAESFAQMRLEPAPKHFFVPDTGLYSAMYPDLAVAEACVDCHNEHPETPKSDWKLNDVMGATTWTYPKEHLSLAEALEVLEALRASFREAYDGYLKKVETFSSPPSIGESWPSQGYYLPSTETFMQEAARRTSPTTLNSLLMLR